MAFPRTGTPSFHNHPRNAQLDYHFVGRPLRKTLREMILGILCTLYLIVNDGIHTASAMDLPSGVEEFPPCSVRPLLLLPNHTEMLKHKQLDCLTSHLNPFPEITQNLKLLCAEPPLEKSIADCILPRCNFTEQQRTHPFTYPPPPH